MTGAKKIFYFLIALVIAGCIAKFVFEVWQSTAYVQTQGREGTLVIGQLYNASRWAGPLPLKKIHTYSATLAPKYQVVIESDQELVAKRQYFIRFLPRNKAPGAPSPRFRPLPGTIRLRAADDGTPVKVEDTAIMERLVEAAIGPLGPGHDPVMPGPQVVPGQHTGTTPFLLGGARESLLELIWGNSQTGEWIALMVAVMLCVVTFLHACAHPWRSRPPRSESKDFIHPAMEEIEPDPPPGPLPRLPFKPGAGNAALNPAPAPEAASPTEPILKLPRK